jgi:hypothetical protein
LSMLITLPCWYWIALQRKRRPGQRKHKPDRALPIPALSAGSQRARPHRPRPAAG